MRDVDFQEPLDQRTSAATYHGIKSARSERRSRRQCHVEQPEPQQRPVRCCTGEDDHEIGRDRERQTQFLDDYGQKDGPETVSGQRVEHDLPFYQADPSPVSIVLRR